ncbi:uncharacterized protein [Centruroides vittatus]
MFPPEDMYFYISIDNSTVTIVEDEVIKFCRADDIDDCEAYGYNKNYRRTTLEGKTVPILARQTKNQLEVKMSMYGFELNPDVYLSKFTLLLAEALNCKFEVVSTSFFTEEIGLEIPVVRKPRNEIGTLSSPAITDTPPIFVIRAAQPLDKSAAFIKPFSVTVWLGIAVSLPVITLFLFSFSRLEGKLKNKKVPRTSRIIWLTIDSLLRQDTGIDSLSFDTIEVIMGTWLLMAFVLTSGYLGILPSFMIFPGKEVIPENFAELAEAVKRDEYSILTIHQSKEFWLFMQPNLMKEDNRNEIVSVLGESMSSDVLENVVESETKALNKVIKGGYALIISERLIKPEIMKMGEDNFFMSQDVLFSSYNYISMMGQVFRNNDDLDRMINVIHQSGIMTKFYTDQLEKARRENEFYSPAIDNSENQMEFDQAIPIIYIMLLGHCAAFSVFICEVVVQVIKNGIIKKATKRFRRK